MAKKEKLKENKKIAGRERPLSPHLTIYKPQITSVLSITHRLTGVFLLFGSFIYVWELTSTAKGGQAFMCYMGFATSWVGILFSVLWFTALLYHFFNGIRHLFWDMGYGFDLKTVTASGIAVIIATIASAVVIFGMVAKMGIY